MLNLWEEKKKKSLGGTEVPKRKNVEKDGREQRAEQCLVMGTERHNWREEKEMVLRVKKRLNRMKIVTGLATSSHWLSLGSDL